MRDQANQTARTYPAAPRQKYPHPPETSPTFAHLMALQRTIGNAAVTRLLRPTLPGEINPLLPGCGGAGIQSNSSGSVGIQEQPVIQRLPTATSNHKLADEYIEMLNESSTFRNLDKIVTSHQPINLVDSGPYGPSSYDPDTHEIEMPARQPTADLRAVLLWEMHNAVNRGPLRRIGMFVSAANSADDSPEQRFIKRYYRAAGALAAEWSEWAQLPEFNHRVGLVNSDLGGGEQVTDRYSGQYDKSGEGWFEFLNYLEYMLRAEHTAIYDPAASENDGWVGEEILLLALEKAPASMVIAEKELREFRSGRRRRVKDEGHNPFTNRMLVWQAANNSWMSGSENSSDGE